MKKSLLLTALAATLAFASGAGAQMTGSGTGLQHDKEQQRQAAQSSQNMPAMMHSEMMAGYDMGPDMMDGEAMGPGMMRGYGMGPGMMGGPYGYRHRMHKRGNCSDFGYWPGRNPADQAKFQKFLDETSELRKKLLLLQFDYREKLRNPATTMQDLFDMQKDMVELQRQIREKAAQ